MSKQERKSDRKKDSTEKEEGPDPKSKNPEKGARIKKDMDQLIDEIDEVLEENAEEFIKNYVQKGGE